MARKVTQYVCNRCGRSHTSFAMKEICESLDDKLLADGKSLSKEAPPVKRKIGVGTIISNVIPKAESKPVTLAELKEYFTTHYGYICCELSDIDLSKWMSQPHVCNRSLKSMADQLSDYLLASGAEAIE